jgi:diguanylate cyclase (GGDEF)-like protein/PAS domain S-box-containing protein
MAATKTSKSSTRKRAAGPTTAKQARPAAPVQSQSAGSGPSRDQRVAAHLLNASTNIVWIYDLVGKRFLSANHALTACLGYTVEELKQMGAGAVERLVHPEDVVRLTEHFASCGRARDGDILEVEYRVKHAFGDWHWLASRDGICDRTAEGEAAQVLCVAEDTTDRRMAQERLAFVSTHDGLTGLYNRAYYQEELKRLDRGRHFPVTVLLADIDGLRRINEARGHAAGDAAIRHAAEIIQSCFRAEDMVARIGEDEFGAFLPDVNATSGEAILARLSRKLDLFNQAHPGLPLQLTFGLATADQPGGLGEAAREADRRIMVKKAMPGGQPGLEAAPGP